MRRAEPLLSVPKLNHISPGHVLYAGSLSIIGIPALLLIRDFHVVFSISVDLRVSLCSFFYHAEPPVSATGIFVSLIHVRRRNQVPRCQDVQLGKKSN
jgi:hypothetical protein